MFPESWQICFAVKGLRAPDEIKLNDDILIRGTPHDDALIFLKVIIENEEEKNSFRDDMMIVVNNLLHVYGVISNQHTQLHSGSAHAQISSEKPFGFTEISPFALRFVAMPTVKQREENTSSSVRLLKSIILLKSSPKLNEKGSC